MSMAELMRRELGRCISQGQLKWGEANCVSLGDEGVRVNGQLVFGENTTGAVQGPLTLALLSDINWALEQWEPRYVTEFKCAVIVHGAWRFDSCQIRASGGTALRSDKLASTRLTSCALGGVLAYDTDGRLCRASRGICATAHSQVFAEGCAVEHTEVHKSHHVGGTAFAFQPVLK